MNLYAVLTALIVALAALLYLKREPLKKWLSGRKVDVKLKAGPLEIGLAEKNAEGEKSDSREQAGVNFGSGNDFGGASVRKIAGRDIRIGPAASSSTGGRTPGVNFGRDNRFREAEIEDIAGRDYVDGGG